ncbi:hypothetical protein SAJA_00175 [Salinisphaera japonica YTM-1]|uniref:Uncharacterized protein n=1 Tax=Salinisphaera japonica YTM-1 TaxID=1209778 RepID=A0A423Q2M9_9GAMM|nr:hypothetical protein SAJA_00175 [Salinisphaera japonica YTM-1]
MIVFVGGHYIGWIYGLYALVRLEVSANKRK